MATARSRLYRRRVTNIPTIPRWLGLAGLLPQAACLLAVLFDDGAWRWTALAAAWGYAALIFSFLGGMWWGLAAAGHARGLTVPVWLWFAAVVPSLIALVTFLPWVFGAEWPGPSLVWLGLALAGSLLVDRRLGPLAPTWWMSLRVPLSLGLGGLTLIMGLMPSQV